MKYLYGNSKESDLDQNYLEFLRLALDFSVSVLQSETKISELQRTVRDAEAKAVVERSQLSKLQKNIVQFMNQLLSPDSMEIAVACRDSVRAHANGTIESARLTIESNLTTLVERSIREISAERNANGKRLEQVLLSCDLPCSNKWVNLDVQSTDAYCAALKVNAGDAIHFEMELTIPPDSLLSELVRLDHIRDAASGYSPS